ncbi:MAG: phosphotransferase [Actinomycetota bacterium]|nr:phosphotransferase [Actinomycetota bacterium]
MDIEELLPGYLGRQRWFAGDAPERVVVLDHQELEEGFRWMIVDADGARYQVLVGLRPVHEPPEFLHGNENAVLGAFDGLLAFDAVLDTGLARNLLARVAPGEEAELVRPIGVEQSHTSLIYDDRLLLKIFRRLHEGPNPEIEITEALAATGFSHVAAPLATWTFDDSHLAVVQPYLSGGTEGWALALTSLRDMYAADCDDPAECGGDFAGEAWRLGEVTAGMHLALAEVFGSEPGDPAAWASAAEGQLARLEEDDAERGTAEEFLGRLRAVADPGSAIRIHGDYHLGQVLRTDAGWFVLDFEGEPARPPEERLLFSSPLQDVANMMRSLQYAAAVALAERDEREHDELVPRAAAWEGRNRRSFLEGYLRTDGVQDLLPGVEDRPTVLTAFELDKAVYEILYERAYRPDWVDIPKAAIAGLLEPREPSSERGRLSLG